MFEKDFDLSNNSRNDMSLQCQRRKVGDKGKEKGVGVWNEIEMEVKKYFFAFLVVLKLILLPAYLPVFELDISLKICNLPYLYNTYIVVFPICYLKRKLNFQKV